MNNETDKRVQDYKHNEMTGKEFCTYFPNLSKKLVKLTNIRECHHGFQFETGLNVDTIPFNPTGECEPGGIYFTDIDNIPRWIEYGGNEMKYYRTVTLPPDCRVYIENYKFKANKIILGDKVEISDLPYWLDIDYCANAMTENISSSKYIRFGDDYIQLGVVKRNWRIIGYLLEKKVYVWEKVKLEAVKQNSYAIIFLLKNKVYVSEEVYMMAINKKNLDFHVINYMIESPVVPDGVREKLKILLEGDE